MMTPDSTSDLETLALAAHRQKAEERLQARLAEDRRLEAELAARRKSPEKLGLEECSECGWWRSPLPDTARTSVGAFRTYLEMSRARCMCTTDRCLRCGEPMSSEVPTPSYYSTSRQVIVRSAGFVMGMAHAARCSGDPGGARRPPASDRDPGQVSGPGEGTGREEDT